MLREFQRWMELKKKSPKTVEAYLSAVKMFLQRFHEIDHPKNINAEIIADYLHQLGQISITRQKLALCALKLFYAVIIHQTKKLDAIPYPQIISSIKKIIAEETILAKLLTIENQKHKAIIATFFGTGIRLMELCTLKMSNIRRDRMEIIVHGKGGRDRVIPLSKTLLDILDAYYRWMEKRKHAPQEYLFETSPNKYMCDTTIAAIYKQYYGRDAHPHIFRHSFAVAFLENGGDIFALQNILGHKDIKTTIIYSKYTTRLRQNIKLPINNLDNMRPTLRLVVNQSTK